MPISRTTACGMASRSFFAAAIQKNRALARRRFRTRSEYPTLGILSKSRSSQVMDGRRPTDRYFGGKETFARACEGRQQAQFEMARRCLQRWVSIRVVFILTTSDDVLWRSPQP